MIFWTNECRIKNKKVFRKLTPVLIHEVISPIKNTQHVAKFLGNRKTPIGYISSKAKYELKLVDNKYRRSNSQHKT